MPYAEFDYDGVFDGFTVALRVFLILLYIRFMSRLVDTNGNVGYASFYLVEISPYHIATLEGHTDRVLSVSFSLDGTLASGSWDNAVKLWDVATRQNIATLWHTRRVKSVSFSPDGATLASGGNDEIKLWDVATRQNIATLWGIRILSILCRFHVMGGLSLPGEMIGRSNCGTWQRSKISLPSWGIQVGSVQCRFRPMG